MKVIIGRELPMHIKAPWFSRVDKNPEIPFSVPAPTISKLEAIISALFIIAAFLVGVFYDYLP